MQQSPHTKTLSYYIYYTNNYLLKYIQSMQMYDSRRSPNMNNICFMRELIQFNEFHHGIKLIQHLSRLSINIVSAAYLN